MMDTINFFEEKFSRLPSPESDPVLGPIRKKAFNSFAQTGIPTTRNEEWKYTRLGGIFNKEYIYPLTYSPSSVSAKDINEFRIPDHENANELVFINGNYAPELSAIRHEGLVVKPLAEAAESEYRQIVKNNLGHSSQYLKDGINALNTSFINQGILIHVPKNMDIDKPVYIYNITDARTDNIFAQSRSLFHIAENARVNVVEIYQSLGEQENFTNQVMEIVMEQESMLEYYKLQADPGSSSLVSSTHIHQAGKSYLHTVTFSLNGGMVRNNLNIVMDAEYSTANLHGLYLQDGNSHIDNHTIVDNKKPNCYSNELYKGILGGNSTGVFNGKIFVQPHAQKTNAYQSNKNILLSDSATINTKPQLEIFADDVKCSHGCSVGQLDEEGLFYLRSRAISEATARALLLHGFACEIIDEIKPITIRTYIDDIISKRLDLL